MIIFVLLIAFVLWDDYWKYKKIRMENLMFDKRFEEFKQRSMG